MTRSVWQAEAPPAAGDLPIEADVVVVGAGIAGAATAWALSREAPEQRVVVLDAAGPAEGASGRNAGFLLLGTHADYASAVEAYGREAARSLWHLTRDNLDLACRLAGTSDVGLTLPGSLLAAGSVEEAERLRRSHALLTEDGVDAEWFGAEDAERRFGASYADGALWVRDGGAVDPVRLVRAALDASGAMVVAGPRVESVETDGDGVQLRLAGGATVRASRVAVCVNAWLPTLLPSLSSVVRPVRAQMLATAPVPTALRIPVYSHDGYFYARQRADGRILVGGARHLHREAEIGYEDAVTDALQADLEAYLAQHIPAAARAAVEQRWSGAMGFSPDALPIVGTVPGVPAATFVGGFTGHGMGFGLRVGVLAARHLLGRPDPAMPWLRADRFRLDYADSDGSRHRPVTSESTTRDGA